MHSNVQTAQTRGAHPTGSGRVRRISAILALGTLPLIAAACAKPAEVGVGAGGAPASSVPASSGPASSGPASSGPATSAPGSSSGGEGGSSSAPDPSSPAPSSPAPSSPAGSSAPSGATSVPDSVKGSAYTATSIKGRAAVKGSPLQISFDASGERSGLNAGCNSMGGAPVFDGDALEIPEIVSTMMACEDGGGAIMKQESWYQKWLTDGVTWTADGTTLTLEGDGVTVVYERSGDADAPASSSSEDPDSPDSSPSTDAGMTTQAEPAPVETTRSPVSGATIEPGSGGAAIPIPSVTE